MAVLSALPVSKAFRVVKGATFQYPFQYLDGIPEAATPFDLTGYTATWTLHTPGGNTTYTNGASPGNSGIFFDNPTTGVINMVISATDTATFTWNSVSYNFSLTSPTNIVTNLLTGAIAVINTLP